MDIVSWLCDNCYNEMEKSQIEPNKNKIYCSNCGLEWYVDDNDEYLNK